MIYSRIYDPEFSSVHKFYIWTLITEPLIYFYFGDPAVVDFKLSRLLQMIFLIVFFLKLLKDRSLFGFYYSDSFYFVFLAFTLFQSFVTVLIGTSDEFLFSALNSEIQFMAYLKIPLELFKYLFYYFYFVILGRVLLSSERSIHYFFRSFRVVFYVSVIVGYALLVAKMFDINLLGRQFNYDDVVDIGFRFNGLFGEPRDAMVALSFGLVVFFFESLYNNKYRLNVVDIIIIVLAIFLTKSGSFMIALVLFPLLYVVYARPWKVFFDVRSVSIVAFFALILVIFVVYNPRLFLYYEQILLLPNYFNDLRLMPYHIKAQIVNIYPLWIMFLDFNPYFLFFGYGFGGSSVLKLPEFMNNISNTNSQMTRLIFDSGVLGFYLWGAAALYPVKKISIYHKGSINRVLFILSVLILSVSLAHRSQLIFIFVGLSYAYLNFIKNKHEIST